MPVMSQSNLEPEDPEAIWYSSAFPELYAGLLFHVMVEEFQAEFTLYTSICLGVTTLVNVARFSEASTMRSAVVRVGSVN